MPIWADLQSIRSTVFGFEYKNPITITASSGAAVAHTFSTNVRKVHISTASNVYMAVGSSPTANASSTFIPRETIVEMAVPASATISILGFDNNGSVVSITELHQTQRSRP